MATATSGSSSDNAYTLYIRPTCEGFMDPSYHYSVDHLSYSSSDSPVTLSLALSGTLIYVSSGNVEFDLPAIATVGAGVRFRFVSGAAGQTITIDPGNSDKILGGGKDFAAVDGGALTWITAGPNEFVEILSGTDWNIQGIRAYSWSVAAA